jgi:hypothetical protein
LNHIMKKLYLIRSLATVLASTLLLASCGGGGGGGPALSPFGTSAQFSEPIAGCAVDTQKSFVRAYLDEVYLWYREIPTVDPAPYTTVGQVADYFDALTNLPKDEFSTALNTGKHATVQQSVVRSSQPAVGELLATHAVPTAPTVTTTGGGRRVGYLRLKNELEGSQDEVIAAFQQLQPQGINDLVLDLRDNLGGFVYTALTTASMITDASRDAQVFERLVFNDKRGEASLLFSGAVQFADGATPRFPVGTALPRLGLPRVFVLTNPDTCSASESIINSLRGVGLQVIRIGDTTCGKPYGFTEKVNCGYSFFAIEFQGFNAAGFGDYQAGFDPICRVADNTIPTTAVPTPPARGTTGDAVFSAALTYADTGNCPTGTATGAQMSSSPVVGKVRQRPVGASRLLSPEMLPR